MKLCGKPLRTKEGFPRGRCTRVAGHQQRCGNQMCPRCTKRSKMPNSGFCRECEKTRSKLKARTKGVLPMNYQTPGNLHQFICGCVGNLPREHQSNKFAAWGSTAFVCRVARILSGMKRDARIGGFQPVSENIPHACIRALMDEPNCERCGEPLKWDFGKGKTPHLHHNHETGEPLGFTHPVCNPRAMENEIDKLRAEIRHLK